MDTSFITHPFFGPLLLMLLSLWPLARIFRRMDKSPWLALLVFLNVVPFLGWIAVSVALLMKRRAA